jgi:hypothetical protein
MSEQTLEARVTAIEKALERIETRIAQESAPEPKGLLSVAGSMKGFPEFEEAMAYGKYVRRTGQLPPPDWNPGDPIPELDEPREVCTK